MPLTSSKALLADAWLDGSLEANLKAWRDAGDSWETIARRIWVATDERMTVTGVTVQGWAKTVGIE